MGVLQSKDEYSHNNVDTFNNTNIKVQNGSKGKKL